MEDISYKATVHKDVFHHHLLESKKHHGPTSGPTWWGLFHDQLNKPGTTSSTGSVWGGSCGVDGGRSKKGSRSTTAAGGAEDADPDEH